MPLELELRLPAAIAVAGVVAQTGMPEPIVVSPDLTPELLAVLSGAAVEACDGAAPPFAAGAGAAAPVSSEPAAAPGEPAEVVEPPDRGGNAEEASGGRRGGRPGAAAARVPRSSAPGTSTARCSPTCCRRYSATGCRSG